MKRRDDGGDFKFYADFVMSNRKVIKVLRDNSPTKIRERDVSRRALPACQRYYFTIHESAMRR